MKFFKTLIAATLGTFLAILLIFIITFITISTTSQEPEPYIQSNSVLEVSLSGTLPSQPSSNPLDELLGQNNNNKVSLQTLKENLDKAKAHDNIEGVLLEIDVMTEGWANLQEAHRVIKTFRDSSDKFVYANTNDVGFNEKGYYLATAADSVFSPPESFFEFDGFFSQVMFLEGTFEKLGLEPEVIRHGKYKGAVEPFFRQELSDENEYQMSQLLEQVNSTFLTAVSNKTGRSVEELNNLLDDEPNLTSHFANQENLIDSLMYADELKDHIKKRIGLDESDSFKRVSHGRYAKVSNSSAGLDTPSTSNKVAVIYANGPIMPEATSGPQLQNQDLITTEFIREQLDNIRNDGNVKAVVLRINSPGGSGSTSDVIWRMLQETREDIPVIASMGGVAASGGYYIAMAADSIIAEPNTVTGSIGVFATKFNSQQLFNEKLGITFDEVKTHEHADWLVPTRDFTSSEEKAMQSYVDNFYQTFVEKVADSRNMEYEEANQHAQGRVWNGADAQNVGLVDELGGLDRAMNMAASKADIEEYQVERFPKPQTFYEMLMGSASVQAKALLGDSWFSNPVAEEMQQQLQFLKNRDALTLLPYDIQIQ